MEEDIQFGSLASSGFLNFKNLSSFQNLDFYLVLFGRFVVTIVYLL